MSRKKRLTNTPLVNPLKAVQAKLDRYSDLLRQRRATAETGHDPKDAKLRPPDVVENYEG